MVILTGNRGADVTIEMPYFLPTAVRSTFSSARSGAAMSATTTTQAENQGMGNLWLRQSRAVPDRDLSGTATTYAAQNESQSVDQFSVLEREAGVEELSRRDPRARQKPLIGQSAEHEPEREPRQTQERRAAEYVGQRLG